MPGPRAGVRRKSFLAGNRDGGADREEGVGRYGREGGGRRVRPGRAGVCHEKRHHLHRPSHEPGTAHVPLTCAVIQSRVTAGEVGVTATLEGRGLEPGPAARLSVPATSLRGTG